MFIPYGKDKRDADQREERPSLPIELPYPSIPFPGRKKDDEEKTSPRGIWTIDI